MQFTLADYKKFQLEKEEGYITEKRHPWFKNLVILNYTNRAVVDRRWNNETMMARGLILDTNTLEVVAKPFPKFFNMDENLEYQRDIPRCDCNPPTLTVKQDGSLGISYMMGNALFWATRGSFESKQAFIANEIWDRKYATKIIKDEKLRETLRGITLLVEIIDPKTRIVVDYEGMSDLILIGAVDIRGKFPIDLTMDSLKAIGQMLDMPVTEQVDLTIDEVIKMKSEIPANEEGWVLQWDNGKRLKVKGDDYMAVHRVAYGLSLKRKLEAWHTGKMKELIEQVPEEFRKEVEAFQDNWDALAMTITENLQYILDECLANAETRKDFATNVKNNESLEKRYQSLIFTGYDTKKINIDVIKMYIYKNYRDFIEEGEEEDA